MALYPSLFGQVDLPDMPDRRPLGTVDGTRIRVVRRPRKRNG